MRLNGSSIRLSVRAAILGVAMAVMLLAGSQSPVYSQLWGEHGELWRPESTLPDFSYAGYHANEAAIPHEPVRWDFKRDFHAAGDGRTDDSDALQRAVQAGSGVLFIPQGKYVITRPIAINIGNLVLRGAGAGKTILYFPKSLSDIKGNQLDSSGNSQWSFGPGLIDVSGKDHINAQTRLATVTEPAERGTSELTLSNSIEVKPGEWVRISESDPAAGNAASGSLIRHLYGDLMPGGQGLFGDDHIVRFLSRIRKIEGQRIQLERPLPYNVRLEWAPEIHRFSPSVQEVGIEELSIEFPWSPYPGHFHERGFNALSFTNVSQCWVRNVEIQNADFGISLGETNFCTLDGVRLTTSATRARTPEARGANGHHGIDIGHGTENLITHFDVETTFVHDISLEWYALHTVFANGRGVDLAMDHHREANYSNLFTDIDCGRGNRPFYSGGSKDRGAHSGAYNTYWNIRAELPIDLPDANFGPLLNFIGVETQQGKVPQKERWTSERIDSQRLYPQDLAQAMRAKRLGNKVGTIADQNTPAR